MKSIGCGFRRFQKKTCSDQHIHKHRPGRSFGSVGKPPGSGTSAASLPAIADCHYYTIYLTRNQSF